MSREDIIVGASAPDFALPDANGNTVRLADYRKARKAPIFQAGDESAVA